MAGVNDPFVRFAIEVMLAGGHHLLLHGPQGSGKTTISRQLPGLLGELDDDDALELTKIHDARSPTGLVRVPQIRSPAPTVSEGELLGSGNPPRPGEVSLAHHGVLVLDDLPEFSRAGMNGVYWAMHDQAVTLAGARIPARFQLLATARLCTCIDEPLLDQIDLVVALTDGPRTEIPIPGRDGELRLRLRAARARQHERLVVTKTPWRNNAEIPASGPVNEQLCRLTPAAEDRMRAMGRPDSRTLARIRRVARTIADLDLECDPAAPIDVEAVMLAERLRELAVPPVHLATRSGENSKRQQLDLF